MLIENKTFSEERALYGQKNIEVNNCRFEGKEDGESALKECSYVKATNSLFALRYPFWHNNTLIISNCELTETCRAPIWYSKKVILSDVKLHGIKALRECRKIAVTNTDIISPEFGWNSKNMALVNTNAQGEYFLFNATNIQAVNLKLDGKYSFQYVNGLKIENSNLNTKDAFWHAKNVVVKNSIINGEYLGWYSENVTFENCIISGTQPLCYCKNLRLINCKLEGCDLAFEKSHVNATITSSVLSIKNVRSGKIKVPSVGEIIKDDPKAKGKIILL